MVWKHYVLLQFVAEARNLDLQYSNEYWCIVLNINELSVFGSGCFKTIDTLVNTKKLYIRYNHLKCLRYYHCMDFFNFAQVFAVDLKMDFAS